MPNRKNNKNKLQQEQQATQPMRLVINLDDYYSLKEVTYLFDVDERTIYNWRKENKIKCIVKNGHVLLEKKHIDVALEQYRRLGFLL